jgi:signal transduction histidine kinase
MTQNSVLRWAFVALGISFHCIAGLQFILRLPRTDIPPSWVGEFLFLLAFSLLTSLGVVFARRGRTRSVLLALQLGLLVLMGIPEGKSLEIETTLSSILIIESILLTRTPLNFLFSAVVIVVMVTVQTAQISFVSLIERPDPSSLIELGTILTLVYVLAVGLSWVTKRLEAHADMVSRLDTTVARLIDANIGFQKYAKEVEGESVSTERKRVSREIHDTIGYTITTLIMLMEAASDLAKDGNQQLKTLLKQGIDQSIFSLDEIRRSLRELRAVEVPQRHGLGAIKKMIQTFADATRIQVSVDFTNVVWNFDEEGNEVFYRMIQESLANAFRHGGATRVRVIFGQTDHEIQVSIWDNGKGSAEIHEGIGLSGMRERIERLNGRLYAQSVADGFKLLAVVPVADAESPSEH